MKKTRFLTGSLAAIVLAGGLSFAPLSAAHAASGRENLYRIGTYLGTAGTIYALAKGEDTWALVGGGATLLSYTQWRKEMKGRHKDENRAAYRRYRTNWLKKHKGKRLVRVKDRRR